MSVKGVVVVTLVVLMWLTESSPTTLDREAEDSIRISSQQEDHPTIPPSWEAAAAFEKAAFEKLRSFFATFVPWET